MSGLLQYGPVEDVHAHGVDHLEVVGKEFRIVYFTWQKVGAAWRRVITPASVSLPTDEAIRRGWPPETWGVPVFEMPLGGGGPKRSGFRPRLVG